MTAIDWTSIGTIASTVALVLGGFLWVTTKIFNLGKTSQRLDSIESDLTDVRKDIKTLGDRLDQRMDKLILTIADSQSK